MLRREVQRAILALHHVLKIQPIDRGAITLHFLDGELAKYEVSAHFKPPLDVSNPKHVDDKGICA